MAVTRQAPARRAGAQPRRPAVTQARRAGARVTPADLQRRLGNRGVAAALRTDGAVGAGPVMAVRMPGPALRPPAGRLPVELPAAAAAPPRTVVEGAGPGETSVAPQPVSVPGGAGPVAVVSAPGAERTAEVGVVTGAVAAAEAPRAAEDVVLGEPATDAAAAGETAETEAAQPPSPREAIAPAVAEIKQRAGRTARHTPAGATVANAQAAAVRAPTEQRRGAAVATVENLDAAQQDTQKFERTSFRQALREAIEAATPKPTTEEAADRVISTGATTASATLQDQLGAQRDAAAGPLAEQATVEVQPAEIEPAQPEVALQPEQVGPPPAPVSAAPAVPAPLPAQRLDYSEDRRPTDTAMAENGVTKAQLEKGNESEFGQTLTARTEAEEHEAQATTTYRAAEADLRGGSEQRAQGTLAGGLAGMQSARTGAVGKVVGRQSGTMTKDAAERSRVTATIDGIKNRTRTDVETILREMETEAGRIFGEGLTAAEKAYRDTFEEEKGGVGTWLTTWGEDWEELIESSLAKARREYLREVDIAIDGVADCVDTKLAAAKRRVVEGHAQVQVFVAGLDVSVRAFGVEALAAVSTEFGAMTESIDARKDALVENLTSQYKASYERMSAMEEELRNANKSLWQRVYDATVGLVKKILAFKDLLLSILAKAADVVMDIISDPIGFLGNLVSGVALGLNNFIANIGAHLKKGLMEWLFGALGGAGITMPENFDLKGIVSIVLQVLGLTYANFRARAVKIVGEPVVSALEKAAEVFKVIATEGVAGLWRFIQEKVSELKSMVLDAIFDYIKEKVIVAGITWLVGLLNPASAFFKACKAIYDIIMFFINRGSQILALVNAVLDSIAAIAKGSIGVAAKFVENALAKAIPVAIGFLASLLSLGDISTTIRKTIEKAQAPVNKAIDWVIGKAVALVKGAGKLIGGLLGGKKKKEEVKEPDDPVKAAKVSAGLAAIDSGEREYIDDGHITRESAEEVAKKVKKAHPVFTSLTVVEGKDRWNYAYAASPVQTKEGELKALGDGIVYVAVINSKEPVQSGVGSVSAPLSAPERTSRSASARLEEAVGQRLEEQLGVTAEREHVQELTAAGFTSRVPSAAPRLLEQQVVTPPGWETWTPSKRGRPRPPLGSAVPDFLVLAPDKVEVFEVTLDANFVIKPQEKGMHSKGEKMGDPHKIIQLSKVRYVAERFPGVPIVYNIQTSGQPMDESIRGMLETQLLQLSRELRKSGLSNPVQIVWRT